MAHNHCVEHNHQINPAAEPFCVTLAAPFGAKLKNFLLVKQFYHPTIERLSTKMTTFPLKKIHFFILPV